MHKTLRRPRRALRTLACAVFATVALLSATAVPASAKAYDWDWCTGVACSTRMINPSASGRFLIEIAGGIDTQYWLRDANWNQIYSGTITGQYSRILYGLNPSQVYFLNIGSNDHREAGGWLCNFTTWPDGAAGPCMI
jgi:hypothetical protein